MDDSIIIDNEVYYNVTNKLLQFAHTKEDYDRIMDTATHWYCEETGKNFTKDLLYSLSSNGFIIDDTGEVSTNWETAQGVLVKKQYEGYDRV
jgi:hypothetical protein